MSLFDIDYDVLVRLLVPRHLRQAKILAWLKALIAPVKAQYNSFKTFYTATYYYANHQSQVVHMEAVLNDRWDDTLRRIVIVDGPSFDAVPLYQSLELKPVPLYLASETTPVYLYTGAEVYQTAADFIVQIPLAIVYDSAEMNATIRRYKLPGKVFTIQQV